MNRRMAITHSEIKRRQQDAVIGGLSLIVGCMIGAAITLGAMG